MKPIQPFSAMWAHANHNRNTISNTTSMNPYAGLASQFNNINGEDKGKVYLFIVYIALRSG